MDTLIRAIVNEEAAIYACDITQMANDAREVHNTWPAATVTLGRTIAGTVLFCAMLKNKQDKLTLSVNGGGPVGTIMAVGNALLQVKGYIVNPHVNIEPSKDGNINIADAVGKNGFITVIRDMGLKEPYIGKTQIETGELAEDLAYYLLKSEQQPSILYLNTWVEQDLTVLKAGGIIVTPMPNCSEKTLSAIEERTCDIKNYALHLLGKSPKHIVTDLFAGLNIKILSEAHPVYQCDCSRERIMEAFMALGVDELFDMVQKDKGAQITCRFCNQEYNFNEQDLNMILRKIMEGRNV
jgi:molecular chaperone Hsp33